MTSKTHTTSIWLVVLTRAQKRRSSSFL